MTVKPGSGVKKKISGRKRVTKDDTDSQSSRQSRISEFFARKVVRIKGQSSQDHHNDYDPGGVSVSSPEMVKIIPGILNHRGAGNVTSNAPNSEIEGGSSPRSRRTENKVSLILERWQRIQGDRREPTKVRQVSGVSKGRRLIKKDLGERRGDRDNLDPGDNDRKEEEQHNRLKGE